MNRLRKWYYFQRADTHLLSFPKCGRTWLRLMLHDIITTEFDIGSKSRLQLHKLGNRRRGIPCILASHDFQVVRRGERVQELDRDKRPFRGSRVLLLVRDPRDVVVSFYYHKTLREGSWDGSMGEFIRHSFDGLPTIVSYYNIWAENRSLPAAFAVFRYEDLLTDTVATLREITDYLQFDGIRDGTLRDVAARYEFRNMQAMEARGDLGEGHATRPADADNPNSFKTRSGRIGGYRDELTAEDRQFVDDYVARNLDRYYAGYIDH